MFATNEHLTPEPEGSTAASTFPKDRSKGANGPPTSADSASSDRPSSTQSAGRAIPSEAIVAEGVGTTPDEALKDAFRNAVRQVVGAVVGAETLIKDDQVIDDKVLTYSDGFIKRYEEVPGSKKSQNGLYRLKIQAAVERRSVVAKLKAANVTVKELDGKGMFAEVVTKLEGQSDAKALIAKAFEDYPANVMQAIVTGKPSVETIGGKTTLAYECEMSVDIAKYDAFQKQTVELLRKVAQRRGTCFVVASDKWNDGTWSVPSDYDEKSGGFGKAWWSGKPSIDDDIVLIINTARNEVHDRTTWEWFHVPRPGGSGGDAGHPHVTGSIFAKKLAVNVIFLDSEGREVVRDSQVIDTFDSNASRSPDSPPGLCVAIRPNTNAYGECLVPSCHRTVGLPGGR